MKLMDLRSYTIPGNINDILAEHRKRGLVWYQPFIFSNTAIVGTGAAWNSGKLAIRQYICTDQDSEEVQKVFLEENLRLGNWYENLVNTVVDCFPTANSFLDIGCNVGHFCFNLVQRGFSSVTGVDSHSECYNLISETTNLGFEYVQGRYSSALHIIPELSDRKFDFAIASAVSTHLSDPHFFLAYASQLATNGMLVTTPVVPYEEPVFRHRITMGRRNRPLPERFEFLPSVSAMEIMLQSVYPYVYRRPFVNGDPKNTQKWGVWFCSISPIPEDKLLQNGLVTTKDRIEEFADYATESCSIPKLRLGEN